MEYIAVAFRSREHTVKFSNFLNSNGIFCSIINTPKEAGVGCGLSVKISAPYFQAVKRAVRSLKPTSFAGYFAVTEKGGRRTVRSI